MFQIKVVSLLLSYLNRMFKEKVSNKDPENEYYIHQSGTWSSRISAKTVVTKANLLIARLQSVSLKELNWNIQFQVPLVFKEP